jgi:L-ascorbate metabolism protein UlaG (beta-lactamase superfamily)
MRLRWLGQAAFRLQGDERTVVIDPFGALPEAVRRRGIHWGYPPVTGVAADLVAVTHEHFDHSGPNAVYRFALDGVDAHEPDLAPGDETVVLVLEPPGAAA